MYLILTTPQNVHFPETIDAKAWLVMEYLYQSQVKSQRVRRLPSQLRLRPLKGCVQEPRCPAPVPLPHASYSCIKVGTSLPAFPPLINGGAGGWEEELCARAVDPELQAPP